MKVDLIKEHFALVVRDESLPPGDYFSGENNIFVCGSLMNPEFIAEMLGRPAAGAFAVAMDYTRGYEETGGKKVHFMMPQAGSVLPGMVWLNLSAEDVRRFEEFEQAPELRKRVNLKVRVGDLFLSAFTYLKK